MIVGAYNDAYVSQKSVRELAQHWPKSQVPTSTTSSPLLSDIFAPYENINAQEEINDNQLEQSCSAEN